MRNRKPRTVSETPQQYVFESANFALLHKVFAQVLEIEHAAFIDAIIATVHTQVDSCLSGTKHPFPAFEGYVSELPLVAEFCIRTGYTKALFESLGKPSSRRVV